MKKLIGLMAAFAVFTGSTAFASNPEIYESLPGERIYGGDPAALVVDTDNDGEGDKVYLYIGEDRGGATGYSMPRYHCYSSSDMVNWTYEGSPMSSNDFNWGGPDQSWAGQVIEYKGKYYYYMCKNSSGISVGISDKPEGPYTALAGGPMITAALTDGKVGHRTIDPTVWIENDENGVEHRYLAYGNSNVYLTELNEDMISVADLNGSGVLDKGDIKEVFIEGMPEGTTFTEAPWIYRREGDDRYYLFFATKWREELSYATADNIWGPYQYGGLMMRVGASSNTNHPAVIDFKGQTYFIYHTGALEGGTGFSRSVCIDRLYFDTNGEPAQLEESSIGLDGTAVKLSYNGADLFHNHFDNTLADGEFPMGGYFKLGGSPVWETDSLWEIIPDGDEGQVFIQSVNKMGFYATDYLGYLKLLHDDAATADSKKARTFIINETPDGASFESLSSPGKYISVNVLGDVVLGDEPAYFTITERSRPTLEVSAKDGEITVNGSSAPDTDLVIVITGENGSSVGYTKTDSDGAFTFVSRAKAGEYTVYAAGRYEKVVMGGDAE